ncbi:MAG: NADH-quinone oxidoreductase subunit I [Bdellovibrionales bacterium]|nr:NADH-quinone oxidoreductase subunit I [Bdellovibrionales bacterium]
MKRREEMTFWERIYIIEIFRGVVFTFSKLVKNLFFHIMHSLGLMKSVKASASIQYPNEKRQYPTRYRGRHRLTLDQEGDIKCTSCFLCATACPARCIYIEAAEHDNPEVEKFPHRYEIDTLLCIYCGYCVEACPVDAIRMDTGIHPEVYPADPRMYIEDKEVLMERSRALEDNGPDTLFKAHMERMQNIEKHPFTTK